MRESKRRSTKAGIECRLLPAGRGVKAGSTCDATICLNDLMATAAAITSKTLPEDAAEDSVSLLGLLTGEAAAAHEATVHQSNKGDLAIRRGDHKLIFFKDGRRELYNLANDLSEKHDVANENSKAVTELTALMQQSIDAGRSTPGAAQQNDFALSLKPLRRSRTAAGRRVRRRSPPTERRSFPD